MAIDATEIYSRHLDEANLDADLWEDGRTVLFPEKVQFHRTPHQSKQLNKISGPRVIIAGSGMLTGGRIIHHLRQRIGDRRNLVFLVGYQALGTRGRDLLEGARSLRMHGQDIPVRAQTVSITGFSGHADADELIRWYRTQSLEPGEIFVTHGEPDAARALAERLRSERGGAVHVPQIGDRFELTLRAQEKRVSRSSE